MSIGRGGGGGGEGASAIGGCAADVGVGQAPADDDCVERSRKTTTGTIDNGGARNRCDSIGFDRRRSAAFVPNETGTKFNPQVTVGLERTCDPHFSD
jgi:hypothetical protein